MFLSCFSRYNVKSISHSNFYFTSPIHGKAQEPLILCLYTRFVLALHQVRLDCHIEPLLRFTQNNCLCIVRLLASARFKSLCLLSLDHQGIGCHLCLISWEWLWLLHLCLILHYDMSNYSSPNLYTQSHTTGKEWIHLTPKQIFFHYIILHSDILYLNTNLLLLLFFGGGEEAICEIIE